MILSLEKDGKNSKDSYSGYGILITYGFQPKGRFRKG